MNERYVYRLICVLLVLTAPCLIFNIYWFGLLPPGASVVATILLFNARDLLSFILSVVMGLEVMAYFVIVHRIGVWGSRWITQQRRARWLLIAFVCVCALGASAPIYSLSSINGESMEGCSAFGAWREMAKASWAPNPSYFGSSCR